MIKDYINYVFKNFRQRKIRSFLTMLGIFIGIATLVALVSLGQGLQEAINEQFELMGVDKIMVFPGSGFFGMGTEGIEITEDDLDVIKKTKGVNLAGGFIYKLVNVKYGRESKWSFVSGMPLDESRRIIESMQNFKIENGRDLKKSDKYKAIMGIMVFEGDFFEKPVKIGGTVEIEGVDFEVVGSMSRIGNPQDDSQFLIPLETAREIYNEPVKYDALIVQVSKGFDPGRIAENMKKELRKARDIEEGEEDFQVQTSEDLMKTYNIVLVIVQAVVIAIAAISLLVGGVGIMNTMYTSILDRTNEIGVMKAIGAKNSDILTIHLIEAGFLGVVGGAVGIVIGMGFSKVVEIITVMAGIAYIKAYFPWYLILGALLFSFIVGAISGALPAIRAAKMKPVDALRYE